MMQTRAAYTCLRIGTGVFLLFLLMASAGCGSGGGGNDGSQEIVRGTPNSPTSGQASTNWSGYVQVGLPGSFNRVSGTWVVPAVNCTGGNFTASAAWTGIGGGTPEDPTLIQAGTGQDCINGSPSYYAWWETIPAPAVTAGSDPLGLQGFEVQAGDRISVIVDGSNLALWNISIQNHTRGWTFNITVPYVAAGATAEWVQEAPLVFGTGNAGQATLSDYGRMTFSALTANGSNPGLTTAERVVMVDGNGNVISNPSAPSGGNSFDVCFGSGAC